MKQLSKIFASAVATVLFATGCSTFFKRNPASGGAKPKHYVMTLHGVRGNEQSYGEFHELIKKHLESVDPTYEVVPLNLTYKTAQLDYTPHKAAAEINGKLDQAIPVLNPEDQISVVAYSMGGQVGLAWYFDSLKDPAHAKYARQTAHFVSLGAAYWGAEEAGFFTNDIGLMKRTIKGIIVQINQGTQELTQKYVGGWTAHKLAETQDSINTKSLFPTIDRLQTMQQVRDFYDTKAIKDFYPNDWAGPALDKVQILNSIRHSSLRDVAKISFEELQALSVAGSTVTDLRLGMFSAPKSQVNHTRWVSISTLVPCFEDEKGASEAGCNSFQNGVFKQINKEFVQHEFGVVRRETDNAVITPSSIVQFHYSGDPNSNYAEGQLTPASSFVMSVDNFKPIFAETLHATLVTEGIYDRASAALGKLGKSWASLAEDVVIVHKEKCEQPETCDHPVYKYILDELSGCSLPNSRCDISAYHNVVGKFLNRTGHEASTESVQNVLKSELHGFTMELNLRVPKNYDVSKITENNIFDYIKTDFATDSNEDRLLKTNTAPYKIQLGRKGEFASILIKNVKFDNETHLKINFTGLITTDKDEDYNYVQLQNGLLLKFGIVLPGLKTRQVEAVVSPYHSTFIDLVMAK